MRQRHSCISHGSNVEHNALRSCHATMYRFVTSMVLRGLGMQQCAVHNATTQKTTFFEFGLYTFFIYHFKPNARSTHKFEQGKSVLLVNEAAFPMSCWATAFAHTLFYNQYIKSCFQHKGCNDIR